MHTMPKPEPRRGFQFGDDLQEDSDPKKSEEAKGTHLKGHWQVVKLAQVEF